MRDKENLLKYAQMGWNVITIWECEVRHVHDLTPLIDHITAQLQQQALSIQPKSKYDQAEQQVGIAAEKGGEYGKV